MTKCLHITVARVCCDPSRPDDSGVTWCSDRATCGHKDDARPLHVATLLRIPGRQQRADYIDTVRSAEGAASAEQLKAALVAAWGTK